MRVLLYHCGYEAEQDLVAGFRRDARERGDQVMERNARFFRGASDVERADAVAVAAEREPYAAVITVYRATGYEVQVLEPEPSTDESPAQDPATGIPALPITEAPAPAPPPPAQGEGDAPSPQQQSGSSAGGRRRRAGTAS